MISPESIPEAWVSFAQIQTLVALGQTFVLTTEQMFGPEGQVSVRVMLQSTQRKERKVHERLEGVALEPNRGSVVAFRVLLVLGSISGFVIGSIFGMVVLLGL